jgi:hypothetical protein
MSKEVSLPKACRIVGRGYGWVYSRLLSGELEGSQVDGRYWLMDRDSSVRLKTETQGGDESVGIARPSNIPRRNDGSGSSPDCRNA